VACGAAARVVFEEQRTAAPGGFDGVPMECGSTSWVASRAPADISDGATVSVPPRPPAYWLARAT
jgi:hypothetical protein